MSVRKIPKNYIHVTGRHAALKSADDADFESPLEAEHVNSAGVSLFLSNGGVPMGNGNLMYTVSHDSQSGKHTVRRENYTSCNMPAEIKYGNIGSTQNSMNGTTSDRTLDFVYGPEHQRVKQVVTLSNNAPTSLMGGTTWYLHGDNNSLLYEKEVKANGVTENRHYLQAAGMTFAVADTRTGAGISCGPDQAPNAGGVLPARPPELHPGHRG